MQKVLLSLIIFLFIPISLFSLSLFEMLENDGFSPSEQNLVASGGEYFPKNIIVDFPSESEEKSSVLIIDIEKENALDFYENGTKKLLLALSSKERKRNVKVLFSANDKEPPISKMSANYSQCGTSAFISQIENSRKSSAIILDFGKENNLVAGSNKKIAPFFLVKNLESAFSSSELKLRFPHLFFPAYRLNLTKNNERLSLFLSADIPCVFLTMKDADAEIEAISNFCATKDDFESEWENHYIFLGSGKKHFWIGEKVFSNLLISIIAISLFLLCEVSFLFGNDSLKRRTAFFRTFAFIPVTIILTLVSLEAGQFLVEKIVSKTPLSIPMMFGIKILSSFIIVSVFYIFQSRLFIVPFSEKSFPYLIDTVEIINICIFSSFDISFVLLFGLEYVLTFISRTLRSIAPLAFSIILMMLPFVPYAFEGLLFIESDNLRSIVLCSHFVNLIFCMMLLPFEFMWVRILIRKKRIILRYAFVFLIFSSAIIFSIALAIQKFQPKKIEEKDESTEMFSLVESNESEYVSAQISETQFLGMYTKHLHLESKAQVLRYEISANSIEGSPVYDCSFDFELKHNAHTAIFLLPDNPSTSFTLDYSSDNRESAVITITAWLKTGERTITKETLKLSTNENTSAQNGDTV